MLIPSRITTFLSIHPLLPIAYRAMVTTNPQTHIRNLLLPRLTNHLKKTDLSCGLPYTSVVRCSFEVAHPHLIDSLGTVTHRHATWTTQLVRVLWLVALMLSWILCQLKQPYILGGGPSQNLGSQAGRLEYANPIFLPPP